MRNKLFGFSLVLSLIGINLSPLLAQAAGASISLTANKASVSAGSSLVVAVYMSGGGTPINAVEADLAYPASKLQYIGLSYTGSAFSINTPSNGGGSGSVSIQNGTINPVSGSALVATVTFKALANSGSAAIGVSGSSHLINANDNSSVPYAAKGLNITFGGAASSVKTSSPPVASSPSKISTPAPPKNTTPPIISAITITHLTPFSATITWTTDRPADSAVDYGLDTNYGLSNSSSDRVTNHSVTLSNSFLLPETTFHFAIKSSDASGNVAISTDHVLNMPGVAVSVVVLGPDGQPQAGAQVSLDGSTATTDSRGSATLRSGLGNKKITTTYQGVTIQKPITVSKTANPLPPYQLDLTKQPLNPWMLTSVGLIVVVLTLLGIDAVLFGSRVFARVISVHFMPQQWHLGHQAVTAAKQSQSAPTVPPQTGALPSSTPVSDPRPASAVETIVSDEPAQTVSISTTVDEPTLAPGTPQAAPPVDAPISAPAIEIQQASPVTITRFGGEVSTASVAAPTKIAVIDDSGETALSATEPKPSSVKKKSATKHATKAKHKPKSVSG